MSDTGSWINLTSFELDVSKKYILMSDNLQNISYHSKTRTLPIWPQDTATRHTEVSDGAWSKNRYCVNLWTLFLPNITSLAWGIGLTLWSRSGTERSIAHSQTQNDTNRWTMVCSHEQTKPKIYLDETENIPSRFPFSLLSVNDTLKVSRLPSDCSIAFAFAFCQCE